MEWHVLGVGAMGGLFARRLHAMGLGVTLLSRDQPLTTHACTLPFAHDTAGSSPDFSVSSIHDHTPINHLLVCTKAFSTLSAVGSVVDRLSADACVVLLGNGMGYHEQIAALLSSQTLLTGTTTAACYRTVDEAQGGYLWHLASEGETVLGHFHGGPKPAWFDTFTQQPWSCDWSPHVGALLLGKLAVNAVINPPTALYNICNGALLTAPYQAEFDAAIDEVASLLIACGEATIASLVGDRARDVARTTARNTSSMRADLQSGRQTEIEAILGYLLEELPLRRHKSHAIPPTPVLSDWLRTVRSRQQGAL